MTSNVSANRDMKGSQLPAPPPPWRKSSGVPEPPRMTRMRQSRTMIVETE
jgi:hypothetical protein